MKEEKYTSPKAIFKLIADIVSWFLLTMLILIAIFLIYLSVATKNYEKKGLGHAPKFQLYTIISQSMEPVLSVYDIIVDVRVDSPEDIKVGDIITFISTSSISSNKTVTHRVIDIIQDKDGNYQYKTKGDNNLSADLAYAEYNNIIGKVVFNLPQLGRLQFFLANQGGWLVVVVIPALFIIFKDVLKIFKLVKVSKKAEEATNTTYLEEQKKLQQEAEEERKRRLLEQLNKRE